MKPASLQRGRGGRSVARLVAAAAVAGFAVLAPIRMAEGAPKTRFAVVPATVTGDDRPAAGAVQPAVPPVPGPVVDSPFPLSHLAVRWVGSEEASVAVRLAGSDGAWGAWRAMPVAHDLEDGDGGPVMSELIRAHGATRAQVRAAGDARDVEIVAIDTLRGPRTRQLAVGERSAWAEKAKKKPPAEGGDDRSSDAASPSSTTATRKGSGSSSSDEGTRQGSGSATSTTSTSAPATRQGAAASSSTTGTGAGSRSSSSTTGTGSGSEVSSTTGTGKGSGSSGTTSTMQAPKPAVAPPSVVTRAEWGADETIRVNKQKFAPITKLFVHHTVTSPDGTDPDPAATVRAIYAYHVQGNRWDDIGYNFLIDSAGKIYEGRWAREYDSGEKPTGEDRGGNGVVGAHVQNHNAGTAAVAMIGDFTNGEPSTAARDALVKLMAWKADLHGIDVTASDPFLASDGAVTTFPNLAGHRDANKTSCPGDRLYPLMPDIRASVASFVTTARGPTSGYWSATADGRVLGFGDATALGDLTGIALNGPIVGMAGTATGKGYWLLGSDGGVFSFGDAEFYGSTGNIKLNKPVVSIAATPTGRGYWFVASDGGIFSFGDAHFFGSTGGIKLNKPVVRMVPTQSGNGYWLVATDGGIFSFGDARFFGSTGNLKLNKQVVSMAPNPLGKGYWLVAADGGLFSFEVPYFGSVPGSRPDGYSGAVQMRATGTGKGYYIADANGGVTTFGDARFLGADTSQRAPNGAIDLVLTP